MFIQERRLRLEKHLFISKKVKNCQSSIVHMPCETQKQEETVSVFAPALKWLGACLISVIIYSVRILTFLLQ